MLPEGVPVALEATRTYKVVVVTAPKVGCRFSELPKPDELVADTSKPAGAVTVMSPDRLLPETVNDCTADAEPAHAKNGVVLPATVIEGNWDCWVTER